MADLTATSNNLPDGHKMPIIGLGTYQGTFETDKEAIALNVKTAIDVGYRHIDTAQMYFAELGAGEGIKAAINEGKVKREELFVTTKVYPTHHKREDVVRHLKKSLERLQLDYVDLYLIHWPVSLKPTEDENFPMDSNGDMIYADDLDYLDTWKGIEDAHDLGLTKSIGISNFNKRQIERLLANCRTKPVNNQVEVNLFFQNKALINFCQSKGITMTGYRNLQFLTGQSTADAPNRDVIEGIARRLGKTIQQVALRFQIQRGVAVIPKSSSETRLRQNLEALNFSLTDADIKALEKLDTNKRTLDIFMGAKEYPFADPY